MRQHVAQRDAGLHRVLGAGVADLETLASLPFNPQAGARLLLFSLQLSAGIATGGLEPGIFDALGALALLFGPALALANSNSPVYTLLATLAACAARTPARSTATVVS